MAEIRLSWLMDYEITRAQWRWRQLLVFRVYIKALQADLFEHDVQMRR